MKMGKMGLEKMSKGKMGKGMMGKGKSGKGKSGKGTAPADSTTTVVDLTPTDPSFGSPSLGSGTSCARPSDCDTTTGAKADWEGWKSDKKCSHSADQWEGEAKNGEDCLSKCEAYAINHFYATGSTFCCSYENEESTNKARCRVAPDGDQNTKTAGAWKAKKGKITYLQKFCSAGGAWVATGSADVKASFFYGETSSKTVTDTFESSVSAEAGVEFEGVGMSESVTSSQSQTYSTTISNTANKDFEYACTTPKDCPGQLYRWKAFAQGFFGDVPNQDNVGNCNPTSLFTCAFQCIDSAATKPLCPFPTCVNNKNSDGQPIQSCQCCNTVWSSTSSKSQDLLYVGQGGKCDYTSDFE
jgi:hypothetical protein